jgi:NADH:ubiquinone oxidoreductase subunit 6 (subunit J)
MLLANYEFYAIVFTTVYVGAVSIFFIFVLMTINLRFEDTLEYYDEIYADKIFSLIFLLFFSAVCHGATFIVFGRGGAKASTDYLVSAYSEIKLTALLQRSATGVEKAVKYTEETAPADSTISFINFPVWDKLRPLCGSANDLSSLSSSLYADMQLNFFLITGILLLSMIAAIGFAVRSK